MRGVVLLEALLAIALFVGAAAFTLAATRNAIQAVDRNRRTLEAVDIARSRLAELEAGLITLEDLRGGSDDGVGSAGRSAPPRDASEPSSWQVSIKTLRSEFTGLTLVELTIAEADDQPLDDFRAPVSYTLRQLVALGPVPESRETGGSGSAPFSNLFDIFPKDRP
jgi:hypothetical protein